MLLSRLEPPAAISMRLFLIESKQKAPLLQKKSARQFYSIQPNKLLTRNEGLFQIEKHTDTRYTSNNPNAKTFSLFNIMPTLRTRKRMEAATDSNELADEEESQTKVVSQPSNSLDSEVDEGINGKEDSEELESLKLAYLSCKKESANKWLDYLKTCYIYLYRGGGEPNENMAAFDLDGTIIRPKSNKRIPKSATDWQFFSAWTKVKLQQVLRENTARFVIFTNQNGVGLNIVPLEEVQERIELVTKRLDIPCTVFVAIDKDNFRKPNTGMFRLFEKSFNDDRRVNLEKSFYCGDAVGYPSHSDADIKFARSLRLPFLPPEKFVRGVKPKLVP